MKLPHLAVTFALLTCAASTQGGIVQPAPTTTTAAILIRVDDKHYDVLFPGFATYPSSLLDGNDDTGVGVGIDPGGVRTVDETEVVDETTGGEVQAMPIFDFKYDLNVTNEFDAMVQSGRLHWNAFVAKPTVPVPSFRGSTLRFRFSSTTSIDHALFEAQIRKAVLGIGQIDSSGKLKKNSRLQLLRVTAILPPTILYYKFERSISDFANNHAHGFSGAPPIGHFTSSTKKPIVAGWRGLGLSGGDATTHHLCNTGFAGGVDDEFTIAWYAKQANAPGTNESTFFGITGRLRCWTGGSAGKGLRVSGWSGTANDTLTFSTDVQTPAGKNWVHFALVFSAGAKAVRLFVNGQAKETKTLTTKLPAILHGSGTLRIGGRAGVPNFYDVDEFRLAGFAAKAPRILQWRNRPSPGVATYGDPSGCLMQTRNGPPARGNANFEIWSFGSPNANVAMVFSGAGTPFPHAGGTWYVAFPAFILLQNTGTTGSVRMPISIPNNSSVVGRVVEGQAYMVTKNNAAVSNAISMSIE